MSPEERLVLIVECENCGDDIVEGTAHECTMNGDVDIETISYDGEMASLADDIHFEMRRDEYS